MKIEGKVVSLELAKRMKKLGWDYETERYWVMYSSEQGGNATYFLISAEELNTNRTHYIFPVPASDAIEIGERLPIEIKIDKEFLYFKATQHEGKWLVGYDSSDILTTMRLIKAHKSQSEVFGKMWCYLKEKKLIETQTDKKDPYVVIHKQLLQTLMDNVRKS